MVQGDCRCLVPGGVQGQIEWGFKKPDLVEIVPAHGRVIGTKLFLWSLQPKLLWWSVFFDSKAQKQGVAQVGRGDSDISLWTSLRLHQTQQAMCSPLTSTYIKANCSGLIFSWSSLCPLLYWWCLVLCKNFWDVLGMLGLTLSLLRQRLAKEVDKWLLLWSPLQTAQIVGFQPSLAIVAYIGK